MITGFKSIIVEGADQQGKSQLCEQLAKLTGFEIKHYGMPDGDFNFSSDYLLEPGVISDRNFMSEIVYSKIRGEKMRIQYMTWLQQMMIERGTLLILCDREHQFVFEADRDEEYKREQILKARELYRIAYYDLDMSKMRFNPNIDKLWI